MPLLVVENQTDGNRAYCTMNEGIGAVLRFGANGPEVIERLKWMRDVLGPVLSLTLQNREPLNVNVLVTKAIAMGDEFHQRNIAASLAFLKEMVPTIVGLDIEEDKKQAVIQFLADTDQFFLNVMMASAKSVMDGARQIQEGTIVTAMCRNGYEFGIRIAGMGDAEGALLLRLLRRRRLPGHGGQCDHRNLWGRGLCYDRSAGCAPFCVNRGL